MKLSRSRSDPQKTLVGFAVGEIQYAVEIGRVVQIVNPLSLSPLPHLPEALVGVSDYRGEVVPVVDMRLRFGLSATTPTRRTKWILVNVLSQVAALVVDSVSDVFGTAGVELRPPPGLSGDDLRGILGVTTHASRLTFVLDLTRLRPLLDAMGREPGAPGADPALSARAWREGSSVPSPARAPSLGPKP